MSRLFQRLTALLVFASLLCTTASASIALGDTLYKTSAQLADGVTLTNQVFWSNSKSDLREEYYATYTPGSNVVPAVSFGSSILSKQTVSSMANSLEDTGERVLTGINGDYFVVATGNPLGMIIQDGKLCSSASYFSALGFYADGTAIIGKPQLSVMAHFAGQDLLVADINKVRTDTGGYYLLTDDFGATTQNSQPGVDVVLSPVTDNVGQTISSGDTQLTLSDTLKIGGRVSCVVDQVLQSTGSISIPAGKFVLTINNKSNDWLVSELAGLAPGDTVDLDVTSPDTRWNNVTCAIGAYSNLVTNSALASDLDTSATAASRTAVGIKADGSVIFYTIDGRQSGQSIGATLTQVANRLLELGCVDAVGLDGGGSTTMGATLPDSNSFSLINNPSDGSQRAVTNAIFLVSTLSPSGTPGSLYVTADSPMALTGATVPLHSSWVDTNWFPMTSSQSVNWSAQKGTVSDDGVYTAPTISGTDTITASGGNCTGSTNVVVISSPSSISLSNESSGAQVSSLTLEPGQSISLKASAAYRSIALASQDTCFSWNVDSSLGTITSDGTFTAGKVCTSGKITVSAGNTSVTVPVTVTVTPTYNKTEDFEASSLTSFSSTNTGTVSLETSSDRVKFGSKSLHLDYKGVSGQADVTANLSLNSGATYLSLWVYGDGSGNVLSANCRDTAGNLHTVSLTTLNFTGWKQLWVMLPDTPAALTGLTVTGSGNPSGEIWLDQMMTSNRDLSDTIPPIVTLTVSGSEVTANISDSGGAALSQSQIQLTIDGKATNFTWESSSGTLTAALPSLSATIHRVTVTATDLSGNIGRGSQNVVQGTLMSSPFADMEDHWADSYVTCLSNLGIVSGTTANGAQSFLPDQPITRGDFSLMTARWMGLNLDQYASVSLPFTDAASIPAWDLNAVKAMYSLGILKGSQSGSTLCANAKASITRAEAMTILGRIQENGYAEADLTAFSDAGQVPSWALDYVKSLVGQGVINGSNGQLRPTAFVTRAEVVKMLLTIW